MLNLNFDLDRARLVTAYVAKKRVSMGFIAGFMFHMAFIGCYQDWIGKQAYLELVDTNWMNTHWLMWAGIALAACVALAMLRDFRRSAI